MSSQNIRGDYSHDTFKIPILGGIMVIVVQFNISADDTAIERFLESKKQDILDLFQEDVQQMLGLSPEEDVTRGHLLRIHASNDIQWKQSIVCHNYLYENHKYTAILAGWLDTYPLDTRRAEM